MSKEFAKGLGDALARGAGTVHSSTFDITSMSLRCANAICPNKIGQGNFVQLTVPVPHGNKRHHFRPIVLWLCGPCADLLVEAFDK